MIPPIASRFVAGETPAEALDRARDLDEQGVGTILNLLGEHYHERDPADGDVATYRQLVADIAESDAEVCVSIKPSQAGLDVGADGDRPTERGREVFRENVASIVETAREHGVFVWLDMEDHPTTDATLDVYEDIAREHWGGPASDASGAPSDERRESGGGVGVCLQANLKRTSDDLERLADVPGKVRLVKGAYDEPESVAYQSKARVNEAYRSLIEQAFEQFDDGVAVGSHDPEMVDLTLDLAAEHDTGFEIQMLMGVREDAQFDLAEDHEVWQYVPYGRKWKSYFYRRVMERKENILFALRAIVGR
jgi:proline dehydrogenase